VYADRAFVCDSVKIRIKRLDMADDYCGVRMPPEIRAQAIAIAESHGLTLSQWLRDIIGGAVINYSGGGELKGFIDAVYAKAKPLAIRMALLLTRQAGAALPETYDEFAAMYGDLLNEGSNEPSS
jgi:hypothetical protein